MIVEFYHPSRRSAIVDGHGWWPDPFVLSLYVYDSRGRLVGRTPNIPDTPHNRRHLRTLAIDWCAHGVTWCEARTASGLPRRGVTDFEPGWVEYIRRREASIGLPPFWKQRYGGEFMGACSLYDDNRPAVREVQR